MANRRVGIELVVDDKGSASIGTVSKEFDKLDVSLAKASTKSVDLSRVTTELGKGTLQLAGNAMNASYALDAFRESGASSTQKLGALMGGMASLSGAAKELQGVTKGLKGAWDEAGGSASKLLSGDVGMGAMVTVAVALGTQVKALIETYADYADEMGELADAEARVNERTAHQREQEKGLAAALGISTAEMRARGITLENINRLAKEDKTGEMTKALEAYTYATTGAARAEASRLSVIRELGNAQDAARKSTVAATESMLSQAGYMNQSQFDAKLDAMTDAYLHVKAATGNAALAAKMFGADILELTANGAKMGRVMPAWLAEITDGLKANQRQTELLTAAEADYQKHLAWEKQKHLDNKNAIGEKTQFELANIKLVTDAYARAATERESYKNAVFTSDLSGSDDERVAVDRNDPRVKRDIAKFKKATDYSGYSTAAAEALATGNIAALKALAESISQDIGRDLGRTPASAGGQNIATVQRATELSGALNTINEALRYLKDGGRPQTQEERAQVDTAEEAKKQTRILEEISHGLNRPVLVTAEAATQIYTDGKRAYDRGLNVPGRH